MLEMISCLAFPEEFRQFFCDDTGLWGDIQLIVWPHLSPSDPAARLSHPR